MADTYLSGPRAGLTPPFATQGRQEEGSRIRLTLDATFPGRTGTQFHKALHSVTRTCLAIGREAGHRECIGNRLDDCNAQRHLE